MDRSDAEEILSRYEWELDKGFTIDLWGQGFWKVVAWVKRRPEEVEVFADRIAHIDQAGFDQGVGSSLPIRSGAALLGGVSVVSLALIGLTYYVDQPWNWLVFGVGIGILLIATHPLAHLVVGRILGIQFTKLFMGFERQLIPEPGVKIDYATYLRAPARRRAWMHASGAITSKLVLLLSIPVVFTADLPQWVLWVLLAAAALTIIVDVVWSTKFSDWKRFRREMSVARELSALHRK